MPTISHRYRDFVTDKGETKVACDSDYEFSSYVSVKHGSVNEGTVNTSYTSNIMLRCIVLCVSHRLSRTSSSIPIALFSSIVPVRSFGYGRTYSGPMLLDFGTQTVRHLLYTYSDACRSSGNAFMDTNRSCNLIGHSRLTSYQEHVPDTHAIPHVLGLGAARYQTPSTVSSSLSDDATNTRPSCSFPSHL